jgi:hypothetical protein
VSAADLHGALVGQLPAVSLPLLAAVLGGFFELDNTGGPADGEAKGGGKKRVADSKVNGQAKTRVAGEDDGDEGEAAPAASKRAKR